MSLQHCVALSQYVCIIHLIWLGWTNQRLCASALGNTSLREADPSSCSCNGLWAHPRPGKRTSGYGLGKAYPARLGDAPKKRDTSATRGSPPRTLLAHLELHTIAPRPWYPPA
ncbi:hypothetical protein DM02DRAFT_236779 [Periconia macrospinosa]|uniref:Secreted protein n=1 Tax=Periconia macrospinosa TaxID=97972 RepID=A0A2V1ED30_9PLEO|nr:hypothetical protein DM02DRAFT_236779 [Periconia macrospinosa]